MHYHYLPKYTVMNGERIYDLCIVGAGLIGTAAASHASKWGSVCLVGPEEPKVRI